MAGIDRLCWDSCIFYAVLKGENHGNGELDILRERVQRFNAGIQEIVASTLMLVEVREGRLNAEEKEKFDRMTKRSNLLLIDVMPDIAKCAADLRNKYRTGGGAILSTPDAIHVATAVTLGLELWTTDARNSNSEAGILPLAKDIKNDYGVVIRRPHGQAAM